MSTIERIINEKSKGSRRARVYKRWRLRCLRNTRSRKEIEQIMEQAELEEAMSRYEHGLEVA